MSSEQQKTELCGEPSGPNCSACLCSRNKGHEGQHQNWHGTLWGGRARLTDAQQDAGGRWHWAEELVDSYVCHCTDNRHGTQHSIGAEELNALESRLSEEQQAGQRAEEERDARPTESEYNALMEQRDNFKAAMNAADQDYVREHERAQIAEAENTRLRAQVDGLEAKAALADEMAEHWREVQRDIGMVGSFSLYGDKWLARIDALTATQEPAAPVRKVCKFYPDEPCPLPNVHCQAPACMMPAAPTQDELAAPQD